MERSGDYESLVMSDAQDGATERIFHPANALDAWRGLLHGIESVDFREVPSALGGKEVERDRESIWSIPDPFTPEAFGI